MSNKIILAMISGNEAAVLPRCVASFAPAVDGLVICWARGSDAPDDSEALVRAVCDRVGLPVLFTNYDNAAATAAWPHVDDFSAARNKAYLGATAFAEMSQGAVEPGWVIWADADDVLPASSAPVIREMAERTDSNVLFFPYVLDANGSHTKRERMGRVEAFHEWIGAVHERIVWTAAAAQAYVPDAAVLHLPLVTKTGSHDRNLRILEAIPEAARTGRDYFYLYSEYTGKHQIPAAIAAGVVAVQRPDLLDEEKYPIYLSMGKWMRKLDEAERLILEALRLMPARREAYAELARLHLDHASGSPQKALGYLRAMDGIPLPVDVSIWHNAGLYGWEADDLFDRALWAAGETDLATQRRRSRFKKNGRKITVLHTTSNPDQAKYLRAEWLQRAAQPGSIEWVYVLPHEIPSLADYPHTTEEVWQAAAESRGKIVVFVEDDIHPPQAWDTCICAALNGRGRAVLRLADPTIEIMTRQAFDGGDVVAVDGSGIGFSRSGRADTTRITISVAHPTCRPEKALEVRKQWLARATHPDRIEYIFGTEAGLAARLGPGVSYRVSEPVPDGFSSAVANYNTAALACTGQIIIAAQDDVEPPQGWDEAIVQALSPYLAEPKVLHVHDGFREDQLMVIMCVTRPYLEQQGYLLCPEYDGYWSDTEFSFRAHEAGLVIAGRQIRFFHNHPAFTGSASDAEYQRQHNPAANARGQAVFKRRNPNCPW